MKMKYSANANASIHVRISIALSNLCGRKWMFCFKSKIICFLLVLWILPLDVNAQYSPPQNSNSRGEQNLQEILAGRRTLEQFSSTEQLEIINAYKAIHPSQDKKISEECENLLNSSKDASNAISEYSKKLQYCIVSGNYVDECYSEFRRIKNAYSDYETSVATFKSRCK